MINIEESFHRYYSDFEGQELELKNVLDRIPSEYILEIKPTNAKPERVWWHIYTKSDLEKLKQVIDGGKVVKEIQTEAVNAPDDSVINKICVTIGHNPARCEILAENQEYALIKLPPVQKEGYYKAPCVIKVNKKTFEYTEIFDSTGTRLGKHVLAKLIEEHL